MPRWEHVRPILVAAYDLIDRSVHGDATGEEVAAALGVEGDDMILGRDLRSLCDADYIQCAFDGVYLPLRVEGTEKGRQEVQGWPGPRTSTASVELLVDLLRAQEDAADTRPEEKPKLRAIRDAMTRGGTDALSKVMAEVILRAGGQII